MTLASWLLGAVMALVALLGLFMAAHAEDGVFQFAGFLFLLFGVAFDFVLIARNTGHRPGAEAHRDAGTEPS